MEDEYMLESHPPQDIVGEVSSSSVEGVGEAPKDFGENLGYDDGFDDEDGGNNFRGGNRGRGNFPQRGRGPPPGWGGPPMRFRGRGYGPGGPPMRGRGYFRGRGGPRFGPNNGPNFDNNWGPMGPPPPGMMGGPPPFGPPPGMMPPGGPMGPPPNMMGQPPFGGPPPGMPPNMPGPELWVETKSEEGKSYYYHSRTRETTWTRPQEGPTVKIITQAEMENMAATGQMPGMGGPQAMPMNGPMGGPNMGGPNMGGPNMGGPNMGGPNMGGPNMGGPNMGGPNMGGPNMGGPPMGGPPMGMMNGMGMGGMMPPGVAPHSAASTGGLPPFMTQPPPWIKDAEFAAGAKEKPDVEDQQENDDMPPGETTPAVSQANAGNIMPFGVNNSQAGGNFPGGGSGGPFPGPGGFSGGAWGGWGCQWPPPLVAQPPPNLAHANVPAAGAATQMPPAAAAVAANNNGNSNGSNNGNNDVIVVSEQPPPMMQPPKEDHRQSPGLSARLPAVSALAAEWSTHRAPDGRPYYYHAQRQESVWEKPKPLRDLEELQAKIAAEKGDKDKKDKIPIDESKIEVIDVEAHAEAAAAAEEERRAADERRQRAGAERSERAERNERAERAEREEKDKEAEKEKEAKAKLDKSRPISSTPISGTPWCVVWTGDGRVFFYNPTAHSSVWERPPQLLGRADVDKAVSNPPEALVQLQRKEAATNITISNSNSSGGGGDLKRTNSDDDDDHRDKRPRHDEKKPPVSVMTGGKIDAGAEAAMEAEVRAARERALVPLEQRMRAFRAMLEDNDVSAFSTWEKELHKIVFDPRYLLLTSKERKQVFDKYMRERAEEERKEKKNRLQQRRLAFRALLEQAKLHSKSSYTDFASKHGRDDRFKAIDKARDRETFFNEYLADVRKKEKEEKDRKRDQAKTEFIALLKEKSVDRHLRWAEAKKKVDSEPRYKAVESSAMREDYFREYCKLVKDERKKEKDSKDKERDRTSKKEKRDKDKEKDKEKEKDREGKEKESKDKKKKEKGDDAEVEPAPTEMETEEALEADGSEGEAARQREARALASIKEREKEVQRALATSLRDRDKEREYHKRDEAVQHFNALLADLVRNPDLAWRDAKKQLKKDHRYSLAELLSKEDKERLFSVHTSQLGNKRRDKLRTLLTDLGVTATHHWRDVRQQLKQDPTTPVYSSATQMEREFRDYQRDKQSMAKTALRQLLQETRTITHKTKDAIKDSPQALQALHDALKDDARYTALDHIPEDRQAIITSYVEELSKKGPPPPPTATEPARRAKQ